MKPIFLILLILLMSLISKSYSQNMNPETLKIKSIHQLRFENDAMYKTYGNRFEMSGIARFEDKILCISDDLYEIFELDTTAWTLRPSNLLKPKNADMDFEAIFADDSRIFLAAESGFDCIYVIKRNGTLKKIISLPEILPEFDKSNTGMEAADFDGKTFYFANEGEKNSENVIANGSVFAMDEHKKPKKLFDSEYDITDLKYSKLHDKEMLYILGRNESQILRYNLENGEIIIKTYKFLEKKEDMQAVFDSGKSFGMGEALLISETEIWVGFDNGKSNLLNNNEILNQYLKTKNTEHPAMPILVIFERGDF